MIFRSRLFALALGASALTAGAVFQPSAAQAIVWDWQVFAGALSGSGTFTTAGDSPEQNFTYTLTGVSGSAYGRQITGFMNGFAFQWNGSTMLIDGDQELLFADGVYRFSDFSEPGFGPPDEFTAQGNDFIYFDGQAGSMTLAPQAGPGPGPDPGPDPVPGPLPLMGAGAAFGWSRKLRRRLAVASPRSSFRF